MKNRTYKFIAIIIGLITVFGSSAVALASDTELHSKGRLEYINDSSSSEADIVLDSADLNTIYEEVENGKSSIATAINSSATTDIVSTDVTLPTFDQLSTAIGYLKQEGIEEGVEEAYNQISTSNNLNSSIYGGVTNLASLESAIEQDNNELLTKIQAEPTSYGITSGYHSIKVVEDLARGNVDVKAVLEGEGENPYLYKYISEENFYVRVGETSVDQAEGEVEVDGDGDAVACTMNYDTSTGILHFSSGYCNHYTSNVDGMKYFSWPYVDIYLIY